MVSPPHRQPGSVQALCCLALMALPSHQSAPTVVLPAGANARAWAGVGRETRAVDLGPELFKKQPWLQPGTPRADRRAVWRGWGTLVKKEAQGERSDPGTRAALCLFATKEGRWRDAWNHLERLGGHPAWSAAVLPALLPGVPFDAPKGQGGLPGILDDGVLLRPAPPPPLTPGTRYQTRESIVRGLRIGAATVDLRVTLDNSGIEVGLLHTSGAAVRVFVLLPEPEGLEIRVEYIDWMRQDERHGALELKLLPGEEERALFGRFKRRRLPLPASCGADLPRALAAGGLWFSWPGLDSPGEAAELEEELRTAAEAMAALLDVPGGLIGIHEPPPRPPWNATIAHLPREAAEARRLLSAIASRLEAWVLRD
ncbi:MAG TPA: hypothetical protein EYQ59_13880 [Planctomycetes bacterium]|jgi:hypothetical protein|nr:hypothetical protein [Planctomycetota bacterium]